MSRKRKRPNSQSSRLRRSCGPPPTAKMRSSTGVAVAHLNRHRDDQAPELFLSPDVYSNIGASTASCRAGRGQMHASVSGLHTGCIHTSEPRRISLVAILACSPGRRFWRGSRRRIVKRGEYLARVGDCADCHTNSGGPAMSGGQQIQTPYGTIAAPNITPDKATGIGDWSDDDFYRAMHDGLDDPAIISIR